MDKLYLNVKGVYIWPVIMIIFHYLVIGKDIKQVAQQEKVNIQ